ncbi:dTMP kinase [Boudabousia tangfeifanii]|uniref:Thymidylate kinase n=1 Tax=Boudabousia tangfeifanii TaxID=1912795 RepID=A0A1D9MLS7_9ACTO|nr:dTMP kinase [Boudabousia tangfeifanii]AOZ73257.1 dTMP kinase [Boudabousia tangfeifanii]
MSETVPAIPTQTRLEPESRGLFISFEGGEAVGKSTQIAALTRKFESLGRNVVLTREPGGTDPFGVQVRQLVQHGVDLNPKAEALLYAADRSYHVATKIRPALAAGSVVITDRYLDSSVAYQGGGRDLGNDVYDLSLWATNGLLPDVTILLDADPVQALARREGATDRIEAEPLAFHQAVRSRYLQLAKENPQRFVVIDATGDIQTVSEQIWQAISEKAAALLSATEPGGGTR